MKIYLDDIRELPEKYKNDGWTVVRTYEDCIHLLANNEVEMLSLDHDLGFYSYTGDYTREKTGYDILVWLEENRYALPKNKILIHSMNPVGVERMRLVINKLY